ncbi:MAG: helix-turn-helix domain-containing protein [Eubacterium sp.]|nr:helix-turn-helix domain-containing protein [Eubacterium sp.]
MTIKELRQLTGLSQTKFAEKYHINKYSLQRWEQNRHEVSETILYLLERIITEVDYKE